MSLTWLCGGIGLGLVAIALQLPALLHLVVMVVVAECAAEGIRCAIRGSGYARSVDLGLAIESCTSRERVCKELRALHTSQGFVTRSQFVLLRHDPALELPAAEPSVFADLRAEMAAHEFTR